MRALAPPATATWPSTRSLADVGTHRHRPQRGRQHPADRAEQAAHFVERRGEIAERLGQPDEHEVAERVSVELAGAEAVLERVGPRPVVVASATRQRRRSPGASDVEVASQPTRRTAVVGDAHDRGDLARVLADRRGARPTRPCPPPRATTLGFVTLLSPLDVPVMHGDAIPVTRVAAAPVLRR